MSRRKEVIYLSGIEIHVITDSNGWVSLETPGYEGNDPDFMGLISLIRSAQTDADRSTEAHALEMECGVPAAYRVW